MLIYAPFLGDASKLYSNGGVVSGLNRFPGYINQSTNRTTVSDVFFFPGGAELKIIEKTYTFFFDVFAWTSKVHLPSIRPLLVAWPRGSLVGFFWGA